MAKVLRMDPEQNIAFTKETRQLLEEFEATFKDDAVAVVELGGITNSPQIIDAGNKFDGDLKAKGKQVVDEATKSMDSMEKEAKLVEEQNAK